MTKHVFSNQGVIQAYVNQESDWGQNGKDTLSFHGDTLRSYRLVLAVKLLDGRYVLNGDWSTRTTNRHREDVMRAIPNSQRVEIPYSALVAMMFGRRFYYSADVMEIQKINILDSCEDTYREIIDPETGDISYEHKLGAALISYQDRVFLSSTDPTGSRRNWRGLYFLTELCDTDKAVSTIDAAYESLKPQEVREAEKLGYPVKRQGEFFFVCNGQPSREIAKQAKKLTLPNQDIYRPRRHFVTRGFQDQGTGYIYAQGVVRHIAGEHQPISLYNPDTPVSKRPWWHVYESPQVKSWSAVGNVD